MRYRRERDESDERKENYCNPAWYRIFCKLKTGYDG